jgi:hypothetical protein
VSLPPRKHLAYVIKLSRLMVFRKRSIVKEKKPIKALGRNVEMPKVKSGGMQCYFCTLKMDKYVEYVMCCEGHDNIPHTTEIPLR